MVEPEKLQRTVEARMKLKARFEEQIKLTPSVADNKPLGTGMLNCDGMPVVLIGKRISTLVLLIHGVMIDIVK